MSVSRPFSPFKADSQQALWDEVRCSNQCQAEAPKSCCSASSRSRASCAAPVFRLADELGRRTSFNVVRRFTVLRLRVLATLLLAFERRRIAHPKAQGLEWDYSRDLRLAKWGAQVQISLLSP